MRSLTAAVAGALVVANVAGATAPVQAARSKPGRPEIVAVASVPAGTGVVNVRVSFKVVRNGRTALKSTRVTSGTRSCTAKRGSTSCTLKSVPIGAEMRLRAVSRNRYGAGPKSTQVRYTAGNPAISKRAYDTSGCTLVGTLGDDAITGTPGNDVICGMGGLDTINAGAGDDVIYSTLVTHGPPFARGATATATDLVDPFGDVIDAGAGADVVSGADGADTVSGADGSDIITGGAGDDVILGQASNDSLLGGPGNDTLIGGGGTDVIDGGAGVNLCDMTDAEAAVETCTYDNLPPTVGDLQVPATVTAGSDVTFTFRASDNIGVWFATGWIRNPLNQHLSGCGGGGLTKIAGDERDGYYRQTCHIPASAVDGTYSISAQTADIVGNYGYGALGTFEVVGGANDTTMPVVESASTPASVVAGTDVTVRYRLTDAGGVMFTTAWFRNPYDRHLSGCGGGGLTAVSGDDHDGWYEQTCRIPVSASDGTWSVNVQFEDYAGNSGVVNGVATFQVTGGGNDVTMAAVENVIIATPVSVGSDASYSFDVRDEGGVWYVGPNVRNAAGNWTPCMSSLARTSGDMYLGHYEGTCTIPSNSPPGTYELWVSTEDYAGNAEFVKRGTFTVQ